MAQRNEYCKPLSAWYRLATVRQVQAGRTWYADARAFIQALADTYGIEPHAIAGATAAISPGVPWEENKAQVEELCRALASGVDLGEVTLTTYGRQAERGRRILAGHADLDLYDIDAILGRRAFKTIAFYHCLLAADCPDVCIDRWIVRAAGLADADLGGRRGLYEALAAAVRHVAFVNDLSPQQAQAIIWVTVREALETAATATRRDNAVARRAEPAPEPAPF